jgi:hypothetical protein
LAKRTLDATKPGALITGLGKHRPGESLGAGAALAWWLVAPLPKAEAAPVQEELREAA